MPQPSRNYNAIKLGQLAGRASGNATTNLFRWQFPGLGDEMGSNKCYRITPDDVTWSNANGNRVAERELFESNIVRLWEAQLQPTMQWSVASGTLCLVVHP